MKHRLKMLLRAGWARLLYHTGLHRLVDRLMPRRLVILAGHCVDAPEHNGFLPKDMKIGADALEDLLRWFLRRGYEVGPVGRGVRRIREPGSSRSYVALTMDDGYKDNATVLAPILARIGVGATVFLETGPLDERRVGWSHRYFWILGRTSAADFLERYTAASRDERAKELLAAARAKGGDPAYHLKRVLKYEADPADRDRVVAEVFAALGGDERALCETLYMTWDDARALRAVGVELGAHTVHHPVLSTLAPDEQAAEVEGSRAAVERELGTVSPVFAYPFGRRWDFDDASVDAARAAGFDQAVTTHAGTNDAATDPFRLHRLMIDADAKPHLLVAEACGGFDLLRRVGLDLSE